MSPLKMLTTQGQQQQLQPRHPTVNMSQQRSRSVPGSANDRNREELIALRQQVEANLVAGRLNRQRCFREDEADLSSTLEIVADLPEDGTAALDLANKLLIAQVPRSFGHKLGIELCSSISRIQARCGVLRDCLRTKCEQCLNIAEVIEEFDAKRSAENKRRRDRERDARRGNPTPGPDGSGLYQTTLQQVGIAVRGGPAVPKAKKGPMKLAAALAETTMKYSASSSSSTSSDASMASVAKKIPRRSPRLKNENQDTATASEPSAVPAEPKPKPEPGTSANVVTPPILPVSPVVAPSAPAAAAREAQRDGIELVQIDGESGTSAPTSGSGSSSSSPSDNLFGSASSTVSDGDKQLETLTRYANDLAAASPDTPVPPLPAASSPEVPRRGIQRRRSMIDEYIPWQGFPSLDPATIHDERERRYGTAYGDALREAMEADNDLTVLTLIKR